MKNQNLFIIGLASGIAVGVAMQNIAMGTALGAGIGLALSKTSASCIADKLKFRNC